MESTRAHPLFLIAIASVCLGLGFGAGSLVNRMVRAERARQAARVPPGGSAISAKRFAAIRQAVAEGKKNYEFEISGPLPVPSGQ